MPVANAPPKDRTKREHAAQVRRCLWSNDDKTFAILESPDGHVIHVDADPAAFVAGQVYRFLGRWEEGRRGPQFKAATFVIDQPGGRQGVVKYLADHCDGVGTRLAERLWQAFGPAAVKTLRETPEAVVAAGILREDAALAAAGDLRQFQHLEATRIDLFGLVAGRGFPGKLVDRAIAKWGAKAPAVIAANPFRLLTAKLPGCGFRRVDKLYLDTGGRPAALKRQALAGWNVLREDRTGSTWVPAAAVIAGIVASIPAAAEPVKATKLAIRGGLFRVRRNGKERWIATADHARQEQRLADAVARVRGARSHWLRALLAATGQPDALPPPSDHQRGEWLAATASPLAVLIGGGGTGKTFTVGYALRQLVALHGPEAVAVCAPTGKAARRATESLEANGLPLRATTIHQLLEIGRNGHDGGGWGFQRNRGRPLDTPYLVVDEASMLDAGLAADLFDAVPPGGHVLLVGDPHQLSPVGHGAPLRDLLACDSVGRGELTEVRRNAGLIVHAGRAVRSGEPVEFAAKFDLAADSPANLRFLDCPSAKALDLVEDVLRGGVPRLGFDPAWQTQILTATNEKSELSRKAVNERFAKALNPDGRRLPGLAFAVNDKVICLKNGFLKRAATAPTNQRTDDARVWDHGGEEVYVANGDVGRVLAVGPERVVVRVGDTPVSVPRGKPRKEEAAPEADGDDAPAGGGIGDWDHAYGITCHKSQGSEWPCVIVLADPAGGSVADRHWWYTAVTRASKCCLVVGDRAAFETQRRRESLVKRKTFLTELLAEGRPEAAP